MALLEDKKQVLEKYGPYVRSLAATVRKQFSANLDLEDLVSYGQMGLLEAAERFDPKVGANFLTFAHYRIKGSIFDGLRKMGILRGADARSAYVGERANAYLSNVSDRDPGNRGSSFDDDVREVTSAVTGLAALFATSLEGTEGLQLADESLPADQRLELEQLKKRVRAAIGRLPDKERKLLEGYYFQGKTLEEAGAEIGQSKSWASRLHARAVESLKQFLEEEERLPPETKAGGAGSGNAGSRDSASKDSRRNAHGGSTDERSGRGAADRAAEGPGTRAPTAR